MSVKLLHGSKVEVVFFSNDDIEERLEGTILQIDEVIPGGGGFPLYRFSILITTSGTLLPVDYPPDRTQQRYVLLRILGKSMDEVIKRLKEGVTLSDVDPEVNRAELIDLD